MTEQKYSKIFQQKQSQVLDLLKQYQNLPKQNIQAIVSHVNTLLNFEETLLFYYIKGESFPIQLPQLMEPNHITQILSYFAIHVKEIEESYQNQQDVLNKQLQQALNIVSVIDLDPNNINYKENKKLIGRYIRDNAEYVKKVIEQHFELVNQDEKALNALNMFMFLKQLFNQKGFIVLPNNRQTQNFFEEADNEEIIGDIVDSYFLNLKKYDNQTFQREHAWVTEEQILDFIEYWIRIDCNILIVYKLTKQKMQNALQDIRNETKLKDKNKQQKQIQKQQMVVKTQQNSLVKQDKISKHPEEELIKNLEDSIKKYEKLLQSTDNEKNRMVLLNTLLTLQQQLKILKNQQPPKTNHQLQQKELLSQNISKDIAQTKKRKSILKSKLQQIFLVYCKKRSVPVKAATFQQIQQLSKIMNLEKFLDFCNDYKINMYIDRQQLKEDFKRYALNLRSLDFQRFEKLINNLQQKNQKIKEIAKKQFYIYKVLLTKQESARPSAKITQHSGKTSQEILKEIRDRKQSKNQEKQKSELIKIKQELKYLKKMGMKKQALEIVQESNKKKKNFSLINLLVDKQSEQKLTIDNLNKFKDKKFDPQSLLNDEDDEYLNSYKISDTQKNARKQEMKIKSDTRAKQIDENQKQREKELMDGISKMREQKIQKGLRVLSRIKS